MKSWISNLIFIVIEVVLVFISFIIGRDAIEYMLDGDFSGYMSAMEDMLNYVHAVGIAFVILSIVFLLVKPLRTKLTRFLSICNILGFVIQLSFMYFR